MKENQFLTEVRCFLLFLSSLDYVQPKNEKYQLFPSLHYIWEVQPSGYVSGLEEMGIKHMFPLEIVDCCCST